MDTTLAVQNYNGGIIVVSYLISVVGAQTTLELLTQRTHIHGLYNWFLLAAAAFVMGAVGIWSMHFIGNQSLTLWVNESAYQLSYKSGYTFASLVVAIACMFLAFAFVGISEKAQLSRIVPSGIFTGLGIVCMHYVGQFAIDYFIIVYKTGYVIGAAIIACVAVTAALYLFFKLREKWMSLWYKRLGCAMLMAMAVCGMHYTALVGTTFHLPPSNAPPPKPKLSPAALIGIISAIVVVACAALIYISLKANIQNVYRNKTNRRLILDYVLFDPTGRVLVKVDGTVPMEQVVDDLNAHASTKGFNANHPLFLRLFQTSLSTATLPSSPASNPRSPPSASETLFDSIQSQFTDAVQHLQRELRLDPSTDLGLLTDLIVTANTIHPSSLIQKGSEILRRPRTRETRKQSGLPLADESRQGADQAGSVLAPWPNQQQPEDEENGMKEVRRSLSTMAISIDSLRLSVEDSDGEDMHLFLTQRLTNEKDMSRLLSQGYRFADPVFISKTMADRLRVPVDVMRHCFFDLQQLTNAADAILQTATEAKSLMGVLVLVREGREVRVLVDRVRRHAIPFKELVLEGALEKEEVEFIHSLQGHSLLDLTHLAQKAPGERLAGALTLAAQQLLDLGTYSKPLYQTAVLQPTVIDVPAFGLTAGPCQLLLFTTVVHTPGSAVAVNRSLDEPFKCIPLALYRALGPYLTDRAAQAYPSPSRPYSRQQQLYQQAGLSEQASSEALSKDLLQPKNLFSLPPPPRSKRKRLSTASPSLPTQLEVLSAPISILPAKDRFGWIDGLLEHLVHAS
ncbi:hypothetical protein G6F46_007171 [Rhizopus delemar]|uniref:MHYT domain-containing protein n=3 Tax=Rhizopus TaxID=4842 RepID=I1C6U1_RHIO9|nr:hypothetical protein RO3G_08881 [Rhizopus delemar RA 99-880]KAG1466152.1 hypothetical protein G6F55_000662 [Rhizopus delemar]KAG1542384.1 hypothetical protein G6F51_007304 [Rhizopus arrhizus]KAG1496402.1 hypothetical protein G6F54_006496 [Rhizopus delemar]KAG1510174.1 hypothetical protein G6F53_006880 [Rhizopus delemar]|eukprot:EIE84171.1 hypothetical protein RO3G_08881 [Rhizopus delemar RA 99-880]